MATPNAGLTAEHAEALFNLKHNGVLTRIDERGQRCGDLYQWGLHPHVAAEGSPLAADDGAFEAAYPLTFAGPQAVTEHALFPAMSAAESLNTAGILVARRRSHRQPHVSEVLQLCRVAMESAALTIWLLVTGTRGPPRPVHVRGDGAARTAPPVPRDRRGGRVLPPSPVPAQLLK